MGADHLFIESQALDSHELNTWLIYNGCMSHMTQCLTGVTSINQSIQPKVKLGNGELCKPKESLLNINLFHQTVQSLVHFSLHIQTLSSWCSTQIVNIIKC